MTSLRASSRARRQYKSQRYTMVTEGVLSRWDLIRARPPAIRTASLDHLVRAGEQRRAA